MILGILFLVGGLMAVGFVGYYLFQFIFAQPLTKYKNNTLTRDIQGKRGPTNHV